MIGKSRVELYTSVQKAKNKLRGWSKSQAGFSTVARNRFVSFPYSPATRDSYCFDISLRNKKVGFEIYFQRVGCAWKKVRFLESFFEDPLNITSEEACLFKLEYGFEYPEELISKK